MANPLWRNAQALADSQGRTLEVHRRHGLGRRCGEAGAIVESHRHPGLIAEPDGNLECIAEVLSGSRQITIYEGVLAQANRNRNQPSATRAFDVWDCFQIVAVSTRVITQRSKGSCEAYIDSGTEGADTGETRHFESGSNLVQDCKCLLEVGLRLSNLSAARGEATDQGHE